MCEIAGCSRRATWWLQSTLVGGANLSVCTPHIVKAKRMLLSSPVKPVTLKERVEVEHQGRKVETWR